VNHSLYEYNEDFMSYTADVSDISARKIVSLLSKTFNINSVLDLGCGPGVWLKCWQEHGVSDLLGVDGYYLNKTQLAIDTNHFLPCDLSKPLHLERKFDLAYSLEVAEHLPEDASDTFVDSLVRHSDVVVFSAAVTGQGGENHINEQPIDYWRKKFGDRGFDAYDFVRDCVGNDPDVRRWYRYNTIVYIKNKVSSNLPDNVRNSVIDPDKKIPGRGDLVWRLRLAILSRLGYEANLWILNIHKSFQKLKRRLVNQGFAKSRIERQ